MNRIKGSLGDSSWRRSTTNSLGCRCSECQRYIEPDSACFASGWDTRHPSCHLKARQASMSPAEQQELYLRILDMLSEEKPS